MNDTATLTRKADLRPDFPGMVTPDGKPWHYLDTAATAQKPRAVIDAMSNALGRDYATVHRGVYARSANMTQAYEAARARVAAFMGAKDANEIVFVRGATEGINLVAQSWGGVEFEGGRPHHAQPAGASLQHRAVADDRAANRRRNRRMSDH